MTVLLHPTSAAMARSTHPCLCSSTVLPRSKTENRFASMTAWMTFWSSIYNLVTIHQREMRILVMFPPVLRFCSGVYIYIYTYMHTLYLIQWCKGWVVFWALNGWTMRDWDSGEGYIQGCSSLLGKYQRASMFVAFKIRLETVGSRVVSGAKLRNLREIAD